MRKMFDLASSVSVAAWLCCGTAALVSACGGSPATGPDNQSRTLAVTLSSIDTPAAAAPGIAGAHPGPAIAFSPPVLDFGVVAAGTTSVIRIVTITNTGDADLSFPVDFQVQDSRFAFGGAGNCKRNLNYAPGASCTASLTYTPTSASAVSGRLTVATNASSTPWLLPLRAGPGVPSAPNHLFVDTTGSDANEGTREAPFKTITKAATKAKAGYVVHVAGGTYRENVITNSSGTASAYITYISDNRWGAKIVAPGGGNSAAWHNRGDHVAIVGFDISGGGAVGINHSGSGGIARKNRIHHIPAAACSGYGGAAISFDQYNVKSGGIADANLVHDIGPLGTNCYRVQGIYTSIPNVTISNNVIYRVVGYAVTTGHCSYNARVVNNTMFNNGGPVEGGGVVITGNTNCKLAAKGNVVANNIIYDNVIGLHEERVSAADVTIYTNNLVYGNKIDWGAMRMPHSNDVRADPAFVTYREDGGGNYRVRPGSPAIGTGSAAYAPERDFLGHRRGASVTLGAYQYGR